MWTADKIAYRDQENFVRAYQGSELMWYKDENNKIFYTSSDNSVIYPNQTYMPVDMSILSNTYSGGQGVIVFNGPVREIWRRMFYNKEKLTSIRYPDSVIKISREAFNGADNLASTDIPQQIEILEYMAFANIQSGPTIGRVINIPAAVTEIGVNPFVNSYVGSYTVSANNSRFHSNNGSVVETNTNTVIMGGSNSTIPSSAVKIGDMAFAHIGAYNGSNTINIPSSVTEIGAQSFAQNQGITKVIIPSGVTNIGNYAFFDCGILSQIYIYATVPPTIGSRIFSGTSSGLIIYVPASYVNTYKNAPGWSTYADKIVAQ